MEILVKKVTSLADAIEVRDHLARGETAIVCVSGLEWMTLIKCSEVMTERAYSDPVKIGDGCYLIAGEDVKVSHEL